MNKRTLLMVVSLVASLALATTGTLAYLSDSDMDTNVMTLGNVDIVQNEQERTEDGELDEFTQNKPLFPAVFEGSSIPWADPSDWVVENDQAWKVVEDNENVVDKFVTVTNTGKSEAFIRTIIAYEGDATYGPEGDYIHVVHNGNNVDPAIDIELIGTVNIDGTDYTVYSYTYPDALAAGETSIPSLKQLYMNKAADNDVMEEYGDTYDVLVLSQAVQTNGFDDAATALDTAFGDVTADNVVEWFATTETGTPGEEWPENNPPTTVSTEEELVAALTAGESVKLVNDIELTDGPILIDNDSDVVLDLNGNTLHDTSDGMTIWVQPGSRMTITGNGSILKADHNENMVYYDGELVVENGTFAYEPYTWGECVGCSHKTNPLKVGCMFVGRASESKGYEGSLTVNGGTFDPGVTNPEAFVTGSGKNVLMFAVLNNHASTPSEMVVYGGTFISVDPALGDANAPGTLYLEGQTEAGVVPAGYTIEESTGSDGRTVYTVSYSK